MVGCAYNNCSYGQIQISSTFPEDNLAYLVVSSLKLFPYLLASWICEWSICLCNHIIYIIIIIIIIIVVVVVVVVILSPFFKVKIE